MQRITHGLLGLGLVLSLTGPALAQGEMVENPRYKYWAHFKPGVTSTYREVTAYTGPEKENLPDGKDTKTITYRLQSVNENRVVVVTTVVEEELLGTVEASPTRLTYPAKVKKANLEAALETFGARKGEDETVKIGSEEIKCKVLTGSNKKDGTTTEYKLYYSEAVPGGVVKRTSVTKNGDQVVAETTVTLRSYQSQPKPKE